MQLKKCAMTMTRWNSYQGRIFLHVVSPAGFPSSSAAYIQDPHHNAETVMYVCMYVCTYVRTYVRMYVCIYVCIYVCMYACMYIMSVCMNACVYECMHVRMYTCISKCEYLYIKCRMSNYLTLKCLPRYTCMEPGNSSWRL